MPALPTDPTSLFTLEEVTDRLLEAFEVVGIGQTLPTVVAILLVTLVLVRLVTAVGHRILPHEEDDAAESFLPVVFEDVRRPLSITIVILGAYLSVLAFGVAADSDSVASAVLTALVVLWTWAAIRVGNDWIDVLQARDRAFKFAPVLQNLWKVFATVASVLLLVSIWNLEVTPFLASAGILGIVIGFAAQDTISNLIGGVALNFDQTYRVGDVILIEGDVRGTVVDIGIRSTTVLTRDNVTVAVPNSVLNSSMVINQSVPQRRTRMCIPLSVAYGTDYRDVERIVLEACEDAPLVSETPQPRLLLAEFGDSGVIFELRAFVVHPLREKEAIDQLYRRIYDDFADEGIVIPFPQRRLSYLDEDGPPAEEVEELRFDERTVGGEEREESPGRESR